MGDLSSKTEELIAEAQAELLDETVFTVDQITGRHYHL
jgi:hypothetical protein